MKQLRAIVIAVLTAALVTGVLVGNNWTARIPDDAATTVLARTVVDAGASQGPWTGDEVPSEWNVGSACLDRLTRPAGGLDLCWTMSRISDADPIKDYYQLRVAGTAFGDLGSGARWAVVRTRLVGQPMDGAFETWPHGRYDGPCTDQVVTLLGVLGGTGVPTDTVCGRSIGSADYHDWSQRLEWYCVGCLVPGKQSVGVALQEVVGVVQGAVPAWEIYGDLGD